MLLGSRQLQSARRPQVALSTAVSVDVERQEIRSSLSASQPKVGRDSRRAAGVAPLPVPRHLSTANSRGPRVQERKTWRPK
jgi:hypothetical protein